MNFMGYSWDIHGIIGLYNGDGLFHGKSRIKMDDHWGHHGLESSK
jgi:hypothetical protein